MKKRILFVDDELKILDGLKRITHGKRSEWDMAFVNGGQEALEELKKAAFDIIITDMRMPKVDGATLLQEVLEKYPSMVRVILSGHAELETALRAVPVAHQFLSKPCNAKQLEEVVDRSCGLQDLLNHESLKFVVGKISNLPVFPKVYQALTKALTNPDVSLKTIACIIEKDMGVSAKVMQLVNSAFFGLSRRVTDINTAVTRLGVNTLKNLVFSVEVFQSFQKNDYPDGFSLDVEQKHAFLTANFSKKMFSEQRESEDAFLAGMLHDIGRLIIATSMPEKFDKITQTMQAHGRDWFEIEKEFFSGVTHAEIGGYLLGIWGLPYPVVEAVTNHHEPTRVVHERFNILSAVYVANQLIKAERDPIDEQSMLSYLEEMGVVGRLPDWKKQLEDIKVECSKKDE